MSTKYLILSFVSLFLLVGTNHAFAGKEKDTKAMKEITCYPDKKSKAYDFRVRGTNDEDVVLAAQAHAKRAHNMDVTVEQCKAMMKTVKR